MPDREPAADPHQRGQQLPDTHRMIPLEGSLITVAVSVSGQAHHMVRGYQANHSTSCASARIVCG